MPRPPATLEVHQELVLRAVASGRRLTPAQRDAAKVLVERIEAARAEAVARREARRLRLPVIQPGRHQFALRLMTDAPARGPLLETDFFRCEHFGRCRMLVLHCLERQGARFPGGNRLGDGSVREKRAGVHAYCAAGDCGQGKEIAARCSWRPEYVWSRGRYSFYRQGSHEQRLARRRLRLEMVPGREDAELSPLEEVALLTPDELPLERHHR